MRPHVLAHVRRSFVRGLFLVLPLLITVWLLRLLFDMLNVNVTPGVHEVLVWLGIPGLERWFARLGVPVIGLLLTGMFVYFLGLLAGNLAGRRLVRAVESYILRIPLVKGIYGSARQLLDAFNVTGGRRFSKVVLVEFPRHGIWTLGFVTSELPHVIAPVGRAREPVSVVPVFLPTTPNPTSGWMALIQTSDLHVVDISIEEAVKLVVSGGIVCPTNLGALSRPWGEAVG